MFGGGGVTSRQFATQYGAGTPQPVAVRLGSLPAQRPLPQSETPLLLTGQKDIRPSGPVADRQGRRQPGGVGTDLTDPGTWRRRYAFCDGTQPVIRAKQHFT
jgi:hypothetical protein